jgi:hypothetical protein
LSGARIGPNCLIGANSLIAEQKEIPANSLVLGAPARIIREVSPSQIELIKMSAEVYVQNHRRFRAQISSTPSHCEIRRVAWRRVVSLRLAVLFPFAKSCGFGHRLPARN